MNRCAVIRDDPADDELVTSAQCPTTCNDTELSTNDLLPGYRIVQDDETLELMQELAQHSEDTRIHIAYNGNVTTSIDSDPLAVYFFPASLGWVYPCAKFHACFKN